ncbi:MAG: hypothetical protein HFE62_02420 [Firmicutes bacterium]|nr:hypothetical protein [Bacillota bacterium]
MKCINESAFVTAFLNKSDNEMTVKGSLFYKIYHFVKDLLARFFQLIHLDRLLSGSVLKVTALWAGLTVAAAPFAPTMLVLLMAIAGFGSMVLRLLCEKDRELAYSPVNKFIYAYAAVYLFSTFVSVNFRGSLFGGLLTVCFILFSIVVINAFESKIQVKTLLFVMTCGGLLVSFYGFYQYIFQDKFGGVWVDTDMFEGMFRVYSTFANPNVLGEYFLIVMPLSVACFFMAKRFISKVFYFGATGAMLICLVLTYSRGCYIGIAVAAAVFLVMYDKRFIFLGFAALLVMPFILPETMLNRILSIGNMNDTSTSYRVYIWFGTIDMLKDYWFTGVGPGESAYNMVYPVYAYNGISAPHSHNTFLQVICDSGVIGLTAFVIFIYQYYKAMFVAFVNEKDDDAKFLVLAGISSASGFFVQSLFDYTFYNYRVMLLFWTLIGLGIVFTKYSSLPEVNYD